MRTISFGDIWRISRISKMEKSSETLGKLMDSKGWMPGKWRQHEHNVFFFFFPAGPINMEGYLISYQTKRSAIHIYLDPPSTWKIGQDQDTRYLECPGASLALLIVYYYYHSYYLYLFIQIIIFIYNYIVILIFLQYIFLYIYHFNDILHVPYHRRWQRLNLLVLSELHGYVLPAETVRIRPCQMLSTIKKVSGRKWLRSVSTQVFVSKKVVTR